MKDLGLCTSLYTTGDYELPFEVYLPKLFVVFELFSLYSSHPP
jgi:hypothetical protein